MFFARWGILVLCGICSIAATGCVHQPYQLGQGWQAEPVAGVDAASGSAEPQICEGSPNKFVDGAGWVLGIPGKVLLFDRRVDNHAVSTDTTVAVCDYLKQNQLTDVCVRVNEYAPGEEWRRLCENHHVGAFWRYTVGSLSLVGYTLIPGRLVGGDRYNPYTNSVYVYSDVPSLAIKSAAYAKDVHQRDLPGTYAAVNGLPIVSLWHESVNVKDALDFIQAYGDVDQQAESQRILYPYYGMCVGGALGGVLGVQPIFIAGSAVVGHVSGRLQTTSTPRPAPADTASTESDIQPAVQAGQNTSQARDASLSGVQQTGGLMQPKQ